MNKYKLSADHKLFIIEHQDSFGGCVHEIKVETLLRILKPVLNGTKPIRYVQTLNPKSKTYILIDRQTGSIVSHHPRKNTPYKGVLMVGKVTIRRKV